MAQTRKQKVFQEVKRKRQQKTVISIVIVAVLMSIIGVGVYALSTNSGNGGSYPFSCLGQEYTTLHVHPYLRIVINTGTGNESVPIPAAVGILDPQYSTSGGEQVVTGGSCFEPLHTHYASGIIHLESSSTSNTYTLGDFFTIWKVTCQLQSSDCVSIDGVNRPIVFNQTDVFGFVPGQGHTVQLLVDGQQSNQYGSLSLNQLDYCTASSSTAPCYPTAAGDSLGTDASK